MPALRTRRHHLSFVHIHMALNDEYNPMLLKGVANKNLQF
jgi:hypothetical protein